jgi:hypothetical protein
MLIIYLIISMRKLRKIENNILMNFLLRIFFDENAFVCTSEKLFW